MKVSIQMENFKSCLMNPLKEKQTMFDDMPEHENENNRNRHEDAVDYARQMVAACKDVLLLTDCCAECFVLSLTANLIVGVTRFFPQDEFDISMEKLQDIIKALRTAQQTEMEEERKAQN